MDKDLSILLIVFNRPEKLKHLIRSLEKVKPEKIYIFADAPRSNISDDITKCAEVRKIATNLPWECEVRTNFSETNLGCKYGPITAINWFFEHVDKGIILEDDCIPNPSFFSFCSSLLDKYQDNEKIMHISGNNFQNGIKRGHGSYYFSMYSHSWGWATWARAWQKFPEALERFPEFLDKDKIKSVPISRQAQNFWLKNFIQTNSNSDSWDSLWQYTIWYNEGLCIIPNYNLVSNIGFDADATHTFTPNKQSAIPTNSLQQIKHPEKIELDREADSYTFRKVFYLPVLARIHNKLRGIILKYIK